MPLIAWLLKRQLKRLVLVISSVQTKEVLERWEFVVENTDPVDKENTGPDAVGTR